MGTAVHIFSNYTRMWRLCRKTMPVVNDSSENLRTQSFKKLHFDKIFRKHSNNPSLQSANSMLISILFYRIEPMFISRLWTLTFIYFCLSWLLNWDFINIPMLIMHTGHSILYHSGLMRENRMLSMMVLSNLFIQKFNYLCNIIFYILCTIETN